MTEKEIDDLLNAKVANEELLTKLLKKKDSVAEAITTTMLTIELITAKLDELGIESEE